MLTPRRAFLMLFLMLFALNACFLAPGIDSFKKLGVTKGDRVQLLQPQIKKLEDSLSWGDNVGALAFVDQQEQAGFAQKFRQQLEGERVVDHKIASVNFSDDGYTATAEVVVRYFKVPYYIVRDRNEVQKWRFNISDGWKLTGREEKAATEDIVPRAGFS